MSDHFSGEMSGGKFLRFMKLTLFLTIVFTIHAYGSVSSQNVNLEFKNASLRQVFKSLKQQTGYLFMFNEEEVDKNIRLSLHEKGIAFDAAMEKILEDLPYAYDVVDDMVIIKPIVRQEVQPQENEPQMIKIHGRVCDGSGEPLPGVCIVLKGSSAGVATDVNGDYTMVLEKKKQILQFSFIGMETKDVAWNGQNELNVTMESCVLKMDEVVVTGYQTIDKRKLTSAITTITSEDLDFKGALTVDQMLEGKVPGLLSMNLSATPGAAVKMRLRGTSTFTGSREPLWVIDGIIYENPVPLSADEINSWDNVNLIGNAITGLNPQDIERIDVLKDASATAIYGTRASNGVIVVTTKTGQIGSTTLSYSFNAGIQRRPNYNDFELMNSKERIDVSREIMDRGLYFTYTPQRLGYEGLMMDYWDKKITFGQFQQQVSELESTNADWFGALYRNSFSHSHNISLSGGSRGTKYYFSIGYTDDKGAEIGADLWRLTARMNLSTRLRDNILLDLRLSGSVQEGDYNPKGYSAFDEAYYTNRTIPVRNPDGSLHYVDKKVNEDQTTHAYTYAKYNILNEFENGSNQVTNKSLNFTASLNWELLPNLRYVGMVGLTTTTNLTEDWMGEKSFAIAEMRGYDYGETISGNISPGSIIDGGTYANSSTNQYSWTVRNQLNYNFDIHDIHHFNIDLGQEAKSTIYKGTTSGTFPGFMKEQGLGFVFLPYNIDSSDYEYHFAIRKWFLQGGGVYPALTDKVENTLSFYGTFTYTYQNRYSINFNLRNDGSNRFGQYNNEKFNPVWSVSGRWNINEEAFFNNSWMETLALRASYGYRGNVPNESPYLLMNKPIKESISGELGAMLNSFPNANLKWEKTSTVNIGLDWSFLRGRISGAFNYYMSKSVDLVASRPVSRVNGMEYLKYNDGEAKNTGIEFSISTRNIDTPNFKWRTSFSASRNKNVVKRGMKGGGVMSNTYESYVNGSVVTEGESVDGFYSYKFAGLDKYGLPRFHDLYGNDPNISREDYLKKIFAFSGSRTPTVFGNFSTEFYYKKITLRAEFNYKVGYKARLLRLYKDNNVSLPFPEDNLHQSIANRWRKPGDEKYTDIPVLTNIALSRPDPYYTSGPNDYRYTMIDKAFLDIAGPSSNTGWYMYDNSDLRVANASHIRIRSVTLGYDLPKKWIKRAGMSYARIDFQAQNLGVIVFDKKLKGQDPDQVASIGMPVVPTFNFGLTVSF